MSHDWKVMHAAVERGDRDTVVTQTKQAMDAGIDARVILNDGLFPGFNVQGERFSKNIIFVPEMLLTAKAMHGGLTLIRPILAGMAGVSLGTYVIGTVQGDLHDIGQTIVGMMLENSGFRVVSLGVNVKPEVFIRRAIEENAVIVGMSALLNTTMRYQKITIEEFVKAGVRDRFRIMVGGAPIRQEWATEIGADGYGRDATAAVVVAKKLAAAVGAEQTQQPSGPSPSVPESTSR
jgi:5-methyltetrahydrofolate--homocysteine methyltransferase